MVTVIGVVVLVGPGAGTGFSEKKLKKSFRRKGKISFVKIFNGEGVKGLSVLNIHAIKV